MNVFARESQIDIMAAKAKADPLEFRLNNLNDTGDNARMRPVLEAAAARFGWKKAASPSGRGVGVACGIDAEVTPPSNQETIQWGRKCTSGKECYPCILTTGDMVRVVKSPEFDRKRVAFFMASGNASAKRFASFSGTVKDTRKNRLPFSLER